VQRAVGADRHAVCLARFLQRGQACPEVFRQPFEERLRDSLQSERRQVSIAFAFPLRGWNQQLVALPERQAVVDPDRAAAEPLAQTRDCRCLQCPQRSRPIVTMDEIAPGGADRHIAVRRQFGRAAVMQCADKFELSQAVFRVAAREA
jgi:hypothetical protein